MAESHVGLVSKQEGTESKGLQQTLLKPINKGIKEDKNSLCDNNECTVNTLIDDSTTYGVLVDNLSSLNSSLEDLNDNNNTDELDEDCELKDNTDCDDGHKSVRRSYSIESGQLLNDKYDQIDDQTCLQLDTLPPELVLHICSFLGAKFVIKTLSLVCKSFQTLVADETFWKVRMGQRWKKKYPAIPVNDDDFNWASACIEREEQHRLWSDHHNNMQFYRYTEGLFAAVDVVHLMKEGQLLAAGSRDRYLSLVDLSKLDPDDTKESLKRSKVFSKMNAHKGWIWSISSHGDTLVTGSWDTYIKFWDLTQGSQEVMKVKCNSAILCTHYEPGCVIAGGYDKKVYHIDPRTSTIIGRKIYHKKPVLCMAVDDNYVVTGSEDETVAVYDRRADKVMKKLKLDSFPMCMSYGMDQLWLGNKAGNVQLVDASDGDFTIVETYNNIHNGKITGIQHGLGSLFTSSTDKTVKVLEPTQNPGVIATLAEHTADIAKISFQNEVLACASSDVSIGIWKPKQH